MQEKKEEREAGFLQQHKKALCGALAAAQAAVE